MPHCVGVGRVDALVNSVGTNIQGRALGELTLENWHQLINANLTAAFNLTQAVVPAMRVNGGRIVHISSRQRCVQIVSGVGYQASKAGVAALAHATMVEEAANNIRVSSHLSGHDRHATRAQATQSDLAGNIGEGTATRRRGVCMLFCAEPLRSCLGVRSAALPEQALPAMTREQRLEVKR